jgi:hypothetical protein
MVQQLRINAVILTASGVDANRNGRHKVDAANVVEVLLTTLAFIINGSPYPEEQLTSALGQLYTMTSSPARSLASRASRRSITASTPPPAR